MKEISSIFVIISIFTTIASGFRCYDGSWSPCDKEPPKLCVKYRANEQINCKLVDPVPEVDEERMKYDFNKTRWDSYSSRR